MNEAVIEAMCRAYWDERGSSKWKNEGEQYRESIRQRMRAAVRAQTEMLPVESWMIATDSVPAPVSDPNHASFSKRAVCDGPDPRMIL